MMTPEDFVIWLRGFVTASHHHNLTPAALEELKAQLAIIANISTTNNE